MLSADSPPILAIGGCVRVVGKGYLHAGVVAHPILYGKVPPLWHVAGLDDDACGNVDRPWRGDAEARDILIQDSRLLDHLPIGSAAVSDAAQTGCYDAFEGYMGISYEESWYGFDGLLPTDQSWAAGDREVVCFVAPYDPDITESVGSAQGQGRTLDE